MDSLSQDHEPVVCQFCWQGSEVEDISGQLHAENSDSGRVISAHHRCMQYASGLTQYKCQVFGGFDIGEVEKEINRGNRLRCAICKSTKSKKSRGASCGCALKSCRKSFHFTCASRDRVAITKRLVVTKDKNTPAEKFVLYRVFCSSAHEEAFRKTLKSDLRGKTPRKRQDDSVDTDPTEEDADQGTEMTVSSSNTSAECCNASEVSLTSPGTGRASRTLQSAAGSPLPLSSPAMSSTLVDNSDDEDGMVSCEQNDDLAATKENDCTVSSPTISNTSHQAKEARKSGLAQPLLCRLTTELSNMSQPVGKAELCSASSGKSSAQQVLDASKSANGWLLRAADCSSMENKSPNIPPDLAKSPEKITKALNDCLANLGNGLVHTERSSKNNTFTRPSKRLSSSSQQSGHCKVSKESCSAENAHANGEESIDPSTDINSKNKGSPRKMSSVKKREQANQLVGSCKSSPNSLVNTQQTNLQLQDSTSCPLNGLSDDSMNKRSDSTEQNLKPVSVTGADVRALSEVGPVDEDTEVHSGQRGKHKVIKCSQNSGSTCSKKSPKFSETFSELSQECVLLIPSDMEAFEQWESQVVTLAVEALQVKVDSVCVWQKVTMKSLPSQLLLFFLLDLVRELENGNNEAVLSLLFDGEYLTSRLNNYVIAQMQVFQSVSDEKAQQDIQAALVSGLERSVKNLPIVQLLRANNGSQALVTLAIDVRLFKPSHLALASLQAYNGLFWWNKDSEAAHFPLSVLDQQMAMESEALALKMWLTKVNPITEVTVLPCDEVLLDETESVASREFLSLAQYLKEKTHTAVVMEGVEGTAVQRVIPLLVFQPVDFLMLNFQEYFRKTCQKFFQSRGLVTGLALVPLSNLHSSTCQSISSLMRSGEPGDDAYTVSVYSAFCPAAQLTSMVLLEISHPQQLDSTVLMAEMQDESDVTPVAKKRRGRPKAKKQKS